MPAGPLDPRWADNANCGSCDAEALFSTSSAQREMRDICRNCSVRLMCLADALQSNMRYGLWGGLTERERRQLLRAVPEQIGTSPLRPPQIPFSSRSAKASRCASRVGTLRRKRGNAKATRTTSDARCGWE